MEERVQQLNSSISEKELQAFREMYIEGLQDEEMQRLNLEIANEAVYAEDQAENTTGNFLK